MQNITDIDDPLLERAARDGIDWRELADREIELFREDMTALRVMPPRDYIGAVEAMDEITVAVGDLLESGAAYRVADDEYPDVYFDITTSGQFGYESGCDRAEMLSCSPSAAATRTGPASGTRWTRCCGGWRGPASRPGTPRWARAARLAHRVHGDRR